MALDAMVKELVEETMKGLEAHLRAGNVIEKAVPINARRMRALILYSQQQMRVQIDGVVVTLVESDEAPLDFQEAMKLAAPDPEPVPEPEPEQPSQSELDELTEFRKWKARMTALGANGAGKGNAS